MKLFERTGGYWVFWTSAVYLAIGLPCALYFKELRPELIQLAWLVVFSMPLWCNPLARWLNMKENHMFNMFKKKPSNVVPFPNQPEYGDGDGPPPQEPKKPAVTYYSLGMTSENRLEFKMGYSAITMNHGGVANLIEQLETFKKQLAQYEGIEEE
jgi:hypothetical protein